MPVLRKIQVKLLLLITATNLVLSCLITNCPRGGKRDKPSITVPVSTSKNCQLCHLKRETCSGDSCPKDPSCGHMDVGRCITHEICCSKDVCERHKSCRFEFPQLLLKKFKSGSVIFEKILGLLLNIATQSTKDKEHEKTVRSLQFSGSTY